LHKEKEIAMGADCGCGGAPGCCGVFGASRFPGEADYRFGEIVSTVRKLEECGVLPKDGSEESKKSPTAKTHEEK
jgi:hypothetical protein